MKKENLQKITELRHELHRYPELSMQEKETARMIRNFLCDNTSLEIVDRGAWFYAVRKGRSGEASIAFRADMDALPMEGNRALPYHSLREGVSHQCGHDGHAAALCGLALELEEILPERTVYLIFQPGEETGQGALLCRELIREKSIAGVYAFHNLGGYPERSIVYRPGLTQPSSEGLKLHFHGKTSHASAPHEGRNPAQIMSKTVLFAEELLHKSWEGDVLCTVTGVRLGNGDFGISPGEGELCLTLRAERESELKQFEEEILKYAGALSEEAGVKTDSSIHDYFPETRNDDGSLAKILRAAEELHMKAVRMESMWRASEDFGWYLKECPGAMVYIGSGEDYPALHTDAYDFNDGILETAVDLFVRLAVGE